jgi:uncharacterized protein (TIGR00369 family)
MPDTSHLTTQNPDYQTRIERKLEKQRFMRHIGFDLTKINVGYMEGEMPVKPHLYQQDDFVHGGVISTVSDIVTGFAAYSLVPPEQKVVTVELKITYFRPGIGDHLVAKGWVEKPGKRFHFCEGEVWIQNEGEEELIAKNTTTMAVFTPDKNEQNG